MKIQGVSNVKNTQKVNKLSGQKRTIRHTRSWMVAQRFPILNVFITVI